MLQKDHYQTLGYTSNGICQIFQGLAALCSAYLIQVYGPLKCMVLPSLFCLLNIAAFFVPMSLYDDLHPKKELVKILLAVSAAFNGIGQGMNQTAVGVYIQSKTTEHNKGLAFGLFWACFMGSLVLGNLFFSAILPYINQLVYITLLLCICLVGNILLFSLFYVDQPLPSQEDLIPKPNDHYIIKEQFEDAPPALFLKTEVLETLKLFKHSNYWCLIP